MNNFLLIFLGGGVGSFCRFLLATFITNKIATSFPLGTLTVNIIGCFLIGLIAGLPQASSSLSTTMRLLLMTGFLGGFTTFSSYEYESFMLTSEGEIGRALLNLAGSVILGFFAVGLGFWLIRLVQHEAK